MTSLDGIAPGNRQSSAIFGREIPAAAQRPLHGPVGGVAAGPIMAAGAAAAAVPHCGAGWLFSHNQFSETTMRRFSCHDGSYLAKLSQYLFIIKLYQLAAEGERPCGFGYFCDFLFDITFFFLSRMR